MSSVFAKGSRSAPRWYARYRDAKGVWRSKRVRVETKADAKKIARQLEARAELVRYRLADGEPALSMKELLARFVSSLTGRAWKTDETRVRLHVAPRWARYNVDDVTLPTVMQWIDEMRIEAKVAPGTQRAALGLLSRAFSWAIARGLATMNPVKLVPAGARPSAAPVRAATWIDDDHTPRRIMELLPEPFDLVFYVAFTSGCRVSEALGLRLEDLDDLAAGSVRVAHSGDGPLKEDRKGVGKVKHVPAAADAPDVLGPWLERRRAAGAGPEDLVFPGSDGRLMPRHIVAYAWTKVRRELGLTISWHHATRTTACSRWASRGVPIDQIATALGHASTAITARTYQRWQRKTFDPRMTRSMTAPAGAGTVIAMPVSPAATRQAAGAPSSSPTTTAEGEHAA